MSYHSKRRIVNTVVYMVLSLIVVSVLCITVITFVSASRRGKKTPLPADAPSGATSEDGQTGLFGKDDPPSDVSSPAPSPDKPSEVPTVKPDDKDKTSGTDSGEIPTNTEPERHFTLPVKGYVQKAFSIALPVWSATMEDHRAHCGIDVSAATGDAVCSIAAGVIAEIREDPLMGVTVSISHEGGLVSVYSNLAPQLAEGIAAGAAVGEGQVIGSVGDTALAETAESEHLHFEMRLDGALVDPAEYLSYADAPKEDSGVE